MKQEGGGVEKKEDTQRRGAEVIEEGKEGERKELD